tara:strand:- start:464 stop:721 length:258 start_codon:yes stop_codon:yes gene_type:complete
MVDLRKYHFRRISYKDSNGQIHDGRVIHDRVIKDGEEVDRFYFEVAKRRRFNWDNGMHLNMSCKNTSYDRGKLVFNGNGGVAGKG